MRPPRLPRNRLLSVEEYLRFEEQSSVKHEYVAGRVYAMAGVTLTHERIVRNLTRLLDPLALRARCDLVTKDVKVRAADAVYYPDVVVRCGARLAGDTLVITDPCLVVEVLSPNTRRTDRREKRLAYCAIPELRTYAIVDQRRRHVERYWRDAAGVWQYEEIAGDGEIAIACPWTARLAFDDVYHDTDVPHRPIRRLRERPREGYHAAPPIPAASAEGDAAG